MDSHSSKIVFNYSTKSYKIFFNILILIVALFFGIILVTLLYFDKLTYIVDKTVVYQYLDYYHDHEQEALLQLQSGNIETIKNSLSDEFADIKKADRVYPVKRKLLLKLAEELYNKQLFKQLLYWSNIWHVGDDRDVTAMISYYTALLHTPGKEREAMQILKQIKINFPNNKLINILKL